MICNGKTNQLSKKVLFTNMHKAKNSKFLLTYKYWSTF